METIAHQLLTLQRRLQSLAESTTRRFAGHKDLIQDLYREVQDLRKEVLDSIDELKTDLDNAIEEVKTDLDRLRDGEL